MAVYQRVKSLAYQLLPTGWLAANKHRLRRLTAQFYRGDAHVCNVCGFKLRTFVSNGSDLLCPNCGSLGRTRRLYDLLADRLPKLTSGQVLHFSPPACLTDHVDRILPHNVRYITTDFVGEFAAARHIDLTDTGLPDNAYDLIVCYHVLEHIERDDLAMAELHRILKPGGSCLIQTPFTGESGPAKEDPTVVTPAARLEHFGQEDHVRVYSVTALRKRLTTAGLTVEILEFTEAAANRKGFKESEFVLVATK